MKVAVTQMAMGLGGLMWARGTRWTCTHITISTTSGAPRWMKASRLNSRSLTCPSKMKLRITTPLKIGIQSSSSAVATVTNCASLSHTSMKPLMPVMYTSQMRMTPVIQENQRKPRYLSKAKCRAMCSIMVMIMPSEA